MHVAIEMFTFGPSPPIPALKVRASQRLHDVGSAERRAMPSHPLKGIGCPCAGPHHRRYYSTPGIL